MYTCNDTMTLPDFITRLSSPAPVPGGGGASALIGAVGAALCSMVANLTTGKKKYAEYQADIDAVLNRTGQSIQRLLALMDKDAAVFEPLSRAYGIPKDAPGRGATLEAALIAACGVPMELMAEITDIADVLGILAEKGSKLAVSDVGVAAAVLRASIEGAALNVFINTKLMRDRRYAEAENSKAEALLNAVVPKCDKIYLQIKESLVSV